MPAALRPPRSWAIENMLGSFNLGKRLYILTFAVVAALEGAKAQNPQKSSAASRLSEKGRSFHRMHLACSLSCSPEAPLAHRMCFWESHFPSWQHAQVFLSEPGGSPINKARILYCCSQQKACTKDSSPTVQPCFQKTRVYSFI